MSTIKNRKVSLVQLVLLQVKVILLDLGKNKKAYSAKLKSTVGVHGAPLCCDLPKCRDDLQSGGPILEESNPMSYYKVQYRGLPTEI
jgi:hypothetical protein